MIISDFLFEEQVASFFPFESNPNIAVAVSGGADSTCLTMLLHFWALKHNAKLTALIVDHGLRPESKIEAQDIYNKLKALGVNAKILTLNLAKKTNAIQQRAREARYEKLVDYCKECGILHLFVGHHFNDQQETIYMRLKRGAGIVGYAGIARQSYKEDLRILRPMLGFTKQDIYETLINRFNINWVEDPSNDNLKFERVRVRKSLEAKNINVKKLQEDRKNFEKKLLQAVSSLKIIVDNLGIVRIQRDSFLQIDDEKIKVFLISRVLSVLSAKNYPASYKASIAVINAIVHYKKITLFGNIIYCINGYIIIHREFRNLPNVLPLINVKNNTLVWDNRFTIKLTNKAINSSYFIKELGKKNYKMLKKSGKLGAYSQIQNVDETFFYTLPYIFNKNNVVILNNQDYICNIDFIIKKCALIKYEFN